jgi:diguanylate cyclase (GGDEF)-like protein
VSLTPQQMLVVLNALPDPVFVLTESGRYAGLYGHADPAYYHDGKDLVGCYLQDVLPAPVANWINQHMHNSLQKNGLIKVEYQLAAEQVKGLENQAGPDGMLWFEGHIQPFPQLIEGERAVIWVARNITPRKQLEHQLLEASHTDPLTGAGNRRYLMEKLELFFADLRRYAHPATLIMFDLDHFKTINDNFGHLLGDQILKTLCEECRHALRENDVLARFGGEEFIIILPNTAQAHAEQTAERIRTKIVANVIGKLPQKINFTISFGVSQMLENDINSEQVLQRVDKALYQAKAAGRNKTVVFNATE